jgi:hypothetical protein
MCCGAQQLDGRRVGGGQVLRQTQEMQIGAIVQNGPTRGYSDGTAEIAHQIEQT